MKIEPDIKLDFDDVLIRPQRTTLESRSQVKLEREFLFYYSPRKWVGIPIICSNMASIAGFEMAEALAKHKMVTCLHKFITLEELTAKQDLIGNYQDYIWLTIGKREDELEKLITFEKNTTLTPNICIDIANGHLQSFAEFTKSVRKHFPMSIIMAGNVATPEVAQELIIYGGVDIVKIQIGPGANCSTRTVTGVGYPTLSCCIECSHAAHGLKSADRKLGLVCSDGGIRTSGDLCKALCAGSDFVMTSHLFAGASECCGKWQSQNEIKFGEYINNYASANTEKVHYLQVYGGSSKEAQEKHYGEYKPYRASEGISTLVKHKGPVDNIVQEILGGIRSCCTYIGSNSIKDMSKCGSFIRVNRVK